MDGKSLDIAKDKLEQLKTILPEAFTEGQVDWEKLRLALGEDVNISDERYVLNWAGKSDAFRALQTPTTATLAPAREESVNFDATGNIFIEGENLEVLKVLQKAYYGKVKMIYIDPPYNTGNDSFVYPDKFSESREDYLKRIQTKDENGFLLKEGQFRPNSKDSGHYHSNWLSMMYPRLFLAKNLLREDGVIFISIDDNEVHNLRLLMNEIFGEENILAELIWNIGTGSEAGHFTKSHEYILAFAKDKKNLSYFDSIDKTPIRHGALKKISRANPASEITFPVGMEFEGENATFSGDIGGSEKQFIDGEMIFENGILTKEVTITAGWAMHDQIISWIKGRETHDSKGQRVKKFFFNSQGILWYEKERETQHPKTVISNVAKTKDGSIELNNIFGQKVFSFPKPVRLLKYLLQIVTLDEGLVLDFFSGSSPLAQAVLELNSEISSNLHFICVQLPEKVNSNDEYGKNALTLGFDTISEIGKERILRVIDNTKKENPLFAEQNQDLGFKVFKLKHSNFKLWRGDGIDNPEALEEQLDLLADPVRPEAVEEQLLFELLLKSGYPLTARIEKREAGAGHYYLVDGELALALSDLNDAIIQAILAAAPQQAIFLDALFDQNDPLKTNTQLQFKDVGIAFHSI